MSKNTSFCGTRRDPYAKSEQTLEKHFNNRYKSEDEAREKRAHALAEFATKCPNPLLHLKYAINNLADEVSEGDVTEEYARDVAGAMLRVFESIMPDTLDQTTKLELIEELNIQLGH